MINNELLPNLSLPNYNNIFPPHHKKPKPFEPESIFPEETLQDVRAGLLARTGKE